MKRPFFFLLLLSMLSLSACQSKEATSSSVGEEAGTSSTTSSETMASSTDNSNSSSNTTAMSGFDQTALPEKGEQIVVMETTKGTLKIRLFPEQAPKTVENFVGLIKKGYYDGLIFHRVMKDFMIQGGDPTGTGMGGESLWGGTFDTEVSMDVSNIRGALAMANAGGTSTNGSQFFINQVDNTYLNGYENGKMKNCSLYGVSCHTVFGQVFEGMDVVDAIAGVQTGVGDKPVEEVKMVKVTVENY